MTPNSRLLQKGTYKPDSREEILKFLSDTQSHYATYHNHKETSAWAGLALYIALLPQLITAEKTIAGSCAIALISIVVLLIFLVFLFIQFSWRRKAAYYVAACIYLRSKYLSEPRTKIEVNKFAPPPKPSNSASCTPCHNSFLQFWKGTRTESERNLPEVITTEAKNQKKESGCCDQRNLLEALIYVLVIIFTIAQVWYALRKET